MFRHLSNPFDSKSTYHLMQAGLGIFLVSLTFLFVAAPAHAQRAAKRNGLAPCTTDSFVRQAGQEAELIYGDESRSAGRGEMNGSPPPYYGFLQANRIDKGIVGQRADGLTTGHSSYLPSAWGRDEFLGAEWSQSGAAGTAQVKQEFAFVIPRD